MKDYEGTEKALIGMGCKIRTTHLRPIVALIKGSRKHGSEENYFPDGSLLLGYGTKKDLRTLRDSESGKSWEGVDLRFHETGGQTQVAIETPDGQVFRGVSQCLPEHITERGNLCKGDQFNRHLGRRIALGRAVKNMAQEEEWLAHTIPATSVIGKVLGDLLEEFGIPRDANPTTIKLGDGLRMSFYQSM